MAFDDDNDDDDGDDAEDDGDDGDGLAACIVFYLQHYAAPFIFLSFYLLQIILTTLNKYIDKLAILR